MFCLLVQFLFLQCHYHINEGAGDVFIPPSADAAANVDFPEAEPISFKSNWYASYSLFALGNTSPAVIRAAPS